jgi:signal transduction histidine kinase
MATSPPSAVAASQARQPRNPISRRSIEVVFGRVSGALGLVFGAQTFPIMLSQSGMFRPPWTLVFEVAIYGGLVLSLVASLIKRYVRFMNAYIAIVYLLALLAWSFVVADPEVVAPDRPWLWFLCTVGSGTAAVAFNVWVATAYQVVVPLIYGFIRTTPSGGGHSIGSAALDTVYAIILGGAVLILVTLLRQAAAAVDTAQSTALERYAHAVRQHATEVERVQVDSIVHDSVLTTLLSAARAYTPEAKELATRMARNAMGHLKDAAAASPDDDATVSLEQLAHRIMGATTTLSAPFDLRPMNVGPGSIPIQSAEAVYSAAVQAMVNSLQHAGSGDHIQRWVAIGPKSSGGIQVDIGDTGAGFAVDSVPTERLGLRVSIIERVANAGGIVDIDSEAGEGTVISIHWPHPDGVVGPVPIVELDDVELRS